MVKVCFGPPEPFVGYWQGSLFQGWSGPPEPFVGWWQASYFVYLHFSWHFQLLVSFCPFLSPTFLKRRKQKLDSVDPPQSHLSIEFDVFRGQWWITGRKGWVEEKGCSFVHLRPGRSHCVFVPCSLTDIRGVSWKGPERSNSLCSSHSRDWRRFATWPVPFGTNRLLWVQCGLVFLVTGLFPGLCLQHVLRLVILCGPVRGAKAGQITLV